MRLLTFSKNAVIPDPDEPVPPEDPPQPPIGDPNDPDPIIDPVPPGGPG